MTYGINTTISDAANRRWNFGDSDQLLEFLNKEVEFWAKQDDSMKDMDDADKHQYIRG